MSDTSSKRPAGGHRPGGACESVTCFLMFAAGSRYETRETNGIAHFTEHMFFKGTERRPTAGTSPARSMRSAASSMPSRSKEYGYYVKCASPQIDTALDVLVDMIRNSKFEPEEIEREKGVILEELNMYLDTPRDMVDNVYEQLLYGDQPLGWLVIGHKESIQNANRDTFLEYMNRWYTPTRLVAGIGGRIDVEVIPRLEELLGSFGGDGAAGPPPAALEQNGRARVRVETKDSDQAHLHGDAELPAQPS